MPVIEATSDQRAVSGPSRTLPAGQIQPAGTPVAILFLHVSTLKTFTL
jgi:hypothetical protein